MATRNKIQDPKPLKAEDKPLSPRLKLLLDLLPKHGWKIRPAGIEAGYSPAYAERLPGLLRSDVRFCKAVEAKRQEFMAKTGWNVEKWQAECVEMYELAKGSKDWPGICATLKMLGQNVGAFEADNRQRATQVGMVIM